LLSKIDAAKRAAAEMALEEILDAHVIGVGSGTTLELLVPDLAKLIRDRGLEVLLVPTSRQIEAVLATNGLSVASLNDVDQIDLAIDGADQVESQTLNLIKGRGAALTREKIVDSAAEKFIVVVDERKLTHTLGSGQTVPVEVIPFAHRIVTKRLEELGKPILRCDDRSNPIKTDNGNFVIDVNFDPIKDAHLLEGQLRSIPGLVETGLFLDLTDRVYVGLLDGGVKILGQK
jgi:ribose 5-phosphate isomerase A